jgi:hypothetical protein
MVVSLDDARTDLDRYVERFLAAIRDAIAEFQRDLGPFRYRMTTRSEASLIHDLMVDRVTAAFADEPGIECSRKGNLFLVNVKNRYLIRLKKLSGRHLRTSNHVTQLSFDFLSQKQLSLPGMPDAATHLNLGYRPGATLSDATYWITCPDGSRLEWAWELARDTQPTQIRIPQLPAKRPARVQPKTAPQPATTIEEAERGSDSS